MLQLINKCGVLEERNEIFRRSPNLPKVFVNYISKGNIITLRKASRQQPNQMIKVNITNNETYGHHKPLGMMCQEGPNLYLWCITSSSHEKTSGKLKLRGWSIKHLTSTFTSVKIMKDEQTEKLSQIGGH